MTNGPSLEPEQIASAMYLDPPEKQNVATLSESCQPSPLV